MWPIHVGNAKPHKETPEFQFVTNNPDKLFTKDNFNKKDDLLQVL